MTMFCSGHNYIQIIKRSNVLRPFQLRRNINLYTNNKIISVKPRPNLTNGGVSIHTSSARCLNPLVLVIVRPLGKLAAMLVGRGFRKWWQSLPKDKKGIFISHLRNHKGKYLISFSGLGAASYNFYDSHIVSSPYTERKRFMVLNSSQLAKISDLSFESEMEQVKEHVLPPNHPKVIRLKQITQRIFRGNPDIPQLYSKFWTIHVVDSAEENCVVHPSGQILMFTGMLDILDNDDQIAIVLTHEMSHVILEHSVELFSHASLLDVLMLVPLALIWAILPNDGIAAVSHWFFNKSVELFLNLPFSRTLESEADSLGLFLAASACFDIREASVFWGRLDIRDKIRKSKDGKPEDIKFLSTHPSHSDRQSNIDSLMLKALETRDSRQCPRLRGHDPRTSVKILQDRLKELQPVL